MMKKNLKVALWFGFILVFGMACNFISSSVDKIEQSIETQIDVEEIFENFDVEIEEPADNNASFAFQEISDTDFGKLLNSGALTLSGINANSDQDDTFGEILTLQLTNPGTDEIIVSLPCGLVFLPADNYYQRLMLVQPLDFTLAPGETKTPTPYVVCIDVAAAAPEFNNTYSLGYLTDNELLMEFAECICNKEIGTSLISMDGVGIQFAAWSIGMGGDFSQTLEENPEMAEFFGQEYGGDVDGAITELMNMISMFGDSWLEDCGIEVEN